MIQAEQQALSAPACSSGGGGAVSGGGAALQRWGQLGRAAPRRHLFSSAESGQGGGGGPKSMLDAALPHTGPAGSALGGAAAQRLRALADAEPAAAGGAGAAGAGAAGHRRSLLRRALSWLFDATIIASLAALAAGGATYCTYSIPEVQGMLADAYEAREQEQQQQQQQQQQQAQADPGAAAHAPALLQAPRGSLATEAWIKALQSYLAVAVPLDSKVREYTDPTCDALLPEQPPEIRGHVKTLVLDLEGVLVHKEWSRAKGWQVMKRPGVEAFLLEMGRRYELVIYTDEAAMYADPVINKIDPARAVTYRLYRQDTQYHNGKHVRDLSKLNRDMAQVLFISADPSAYEFQPQNTLKLKPWDHNPQDTTLLDLIPFLQMVQEAHVNDTRDVVRSYDGEDNVAAAFKQRMAQLAAGQKRGGGGRLGRLGRSQ